MALTLRDIQTRRSQSRLRFLMVLLEPFGQLAMMYVVFWGIGRKPDFGQSLFMFLVSGILPYFLFTHVSSRIMGSIRIASPFRALRVVTPVDVAVAKLVVEVLTILVVGFVVFGISYFIGMTDGQICDPLQLVLSIAVLSATAFGMGLLNAGLARVFGLWPLIWTITARSLIFLSNVFYVVDYQPMHIRNILWWNPVLHGVIWFRSGVFWHYPTSTLSRTYLIGFTLVAILLALTLERLLRRSG